MGSKTPQDDDHGGYSTSCPCHQQPHSNVPQMTLPSLSRLPAPADSPVAHSMPLTMTEVSATEATAMMETPTATRHPYPWR